MFIATPAAPQRLPSVPKSWFTAFYAVGLGVDAAAIAAAAVVGTAPPLAMLPAAAFAVHLVRRLYECLAVHAWGAGARMPAHLWAAGVAHYLLAPLTLLPAAVAGGPSSLLGPVDRVLVAAAGGALFVWGNYEQHMSHAHLAALRAPTARRPARGPQETEEAGAGSSDGRVAATRRRGAGEPPARSPQPSSSSSSSSYVLPTGRLFDAVVCPHYTAEIALYAGLALLHAACATGGGGGSVPLAACAASVGGGTAWLLPAGTAASAATAAALCRAAASAGPWLLLVWVAANLTATARHTREWYAAAVPGAAGEIRRRAAVWPPLAALRRYGGLIKG